MPRTRWLAAFVVTAACGSKPPVDPLGPLRPTRGDGHDGQADIAATRNAEGIAAYRAGKYADASAKFSEAAARLPDPRYFMNMCIAKYREDKLDEAKVACSAIAHMDSSPELRAQAERAITRIEADGQRRGIDTTIRTGNPPPPNAD